MRHFSRDKVEAVTEKTSERLLKVAEKRSDLNPTDFYRDLLHVLAIHVRKCGQEELGEQVEEFLIGHTTPSSETGER